MSVNPVLLMQLINSYHFQTEKGQRTFNFQKNNRMRVHKETNDELFHRKSFLSEDVRKLTENTLQEKLEKALKNRLGKVYVDPEMENIAVPLETATGATGFGVLPTGSRIFIPEGKFVRAFTYWEKVNDIDLSCFALTEDFKQEEFSWRNMYGKQSEEIAYSGDQTSGYNGGSEYFDVNIDLFREKHPDARYIVFCDNIYSDLSFDKCVCTAGFMVRNKYDTEEWKGEVNSSSRKVFDPKTVETSFGVTADATFAYLFAIDLKTRQMIWLNLTRKDSVHVAGTTEMAWLNRYFEATEIFNVAKLYRYAAKELVSDPTDAEIIVSDHVDSEGEIVHSYDTEKVLNLLHA